MAARQTVVATLTLQVAGVPGIYNLTFVNGYFDSPTGQRWPIDPGAALQIEVTNKKK